MTRTRASVVSVADTPYYWLGPRDVGCGGFSFADRGAWLSIASRIASTSARSWGHPVASFAATNQVSNAMGMEGGQKVFVVLVHPAPSPIH